MGRHISEQESQLETTNEVSIKIKTINELTRAEIARLRNLTFKDGVMRYEINTKCLSVKNNIYVLAYMKSNIVGWGVIVERNRVENRILELMLYVAAKHRRKNVGSKILDRMVELAENNNCRWRVIPHDWTSECFFKNNSIRSENVDFIHYLNIDNYKDVWNATAKRKTAASS